MSEIYQPVVYLVVYTCWGQIEVVIMLRDLLRLADCFLDLDENIIFPHATNYKNGKIDFLHCLLSKHTLSAPGERYRKY